MRILQRLGVFAAAAGVTCALFIDYCNLIFRCGCQSLWAAADAHCNIHHPSPPHCPFCAHGSAGYAIVLAWILLPQFALSWWPAGRSWVMRLVLAVAAFPVAAGIAAVGLGWFDGYWK